MIKDAYRLNHLTLSQMTECGKNMRQCARGATSVEEAAQKIVAHLYEHCLDESNQPSCALIRLFMTLSFGQLPTDLRALAAEALGRANPSAETQCLVLLGTRGEAPEWNQRQQSRGHQVIPLPDEASIARIPHDFWAVSQFGVELGQVAALNRELLVDLENKEFNVFHVPVAKDSPYIPAQKEFVKPMGVRSVLGCGGVLPEGGLFAPYCFLQGGHSSRHRGTLSLTAFEHQIGIVAFGSAQYFCYLMMSEKQKMKKAQTP